MKEALLLAVGRLVCTTPWYVICCVPFYAHRRISRSKIAAVITGISMLFFVCNIVNISSLSFSASVFSSIIVSFSYCAFIGSSSIFMYLLILYSVAYVIMIIFVFQKICY